MSYDMECPYCDAEVEVCHDDGFGYEEGVSHEMECPECEKNFIFYTYISFDYEPHKAECLNGGEHKMKKSTYAPACFPDSATCTECGLEDRGKYDEDAYRKKIMTHPKLPIREDCSVLGDHPKMIVLGPDESRMSLMRKIRKSSAIANNAIYFNDGSDYLSSLWEILEILNPDIFEEGEIPKLEYIEENDENDNKEKN